MQAQPGGEEEPRRGAREQAHQPSIVPGTWLLVLQPREAAPLLEHSTPRRRPERVRYPWER